ncbi:MAG: CoA-binding protein [Bacteroidales bacterium]
MTTKQQINDFFSGAPIAVAGVSRNQKKFGYIAFKEVLDRGLEVVPVNPKSDQIAGFDCYPSVSALPGGIHALWILTGKENTAGVLAEALDKGIRNIWIQQSSDTPEALSLLAGREVNAITGECLLMHYKPKGIHKFHRTLKGWFGRLPK